LISKKIVGKKLKILKSTTTDTTEYSILGGTEILHIELEIGIPFPSP